MEVAGTAVGVAALGIQVCEGLLKYYRDWKDFEDDIREAYDSSPSVVSLLHSWEQSYLDSKLPMSMISTAL